ncbi:hypothetical protein FGO68_gene16283 [Halteria grandinella]|uniref:Uncharacterized protein n=1 Tax=Halteria grandinella TaxID=5974 RepID=A0A8J8SXZ8_HALGN|nr:hypothetical protein FGO68_gene16283 [Halteria grandinella]
MMDWKGNIHRAKKLLLLFRYFLLTFQKGRKPNAYEDSLIQSLLAHLNEKEDLLKKKCYYRKINPESFRDFLNSTTPYELWKIIQDIKGGYYFFEVFENQKEEYGINYSCIDKLMMCSKAYEREFEFYKGTIKKQYDLHFATLKQEMNKLSQITINSYQEPICLVLKEDPELQCNCNQRGAILLIRQWSFINQMQKVLLNCQTKSMDFKEYFKTIILNLDSWINKFNQQFDKLIKINDILKSKLMSLRVINQQLQSEQQRLTKNWKQQDDEVFKLKQLIQKQQLEKAQIQTKLINTENALQKIKEVSESHIVNKKKFLNESLELLENQNNQIERLFKQQFTSQVTQTENSFEYQLCTICRGENALFQNIQQLKIPQIEFEKIDFKEEFSKEKGTQTDQKLDIFQKGSTDRQSHSPLFSRRRGRTTHSILNENSSQQKHLTKSPPKSNITVRPVFKRLFDDSEKKKLRQSQLTTRIQDGERNQWEEMLSLLKLLKTDRNSQDIQKKVDKSVELYKDRFETKGKLPQLKLKEKSKVSEHLIDTLMKDLQDNKKVALSNLVEQFQTILTVNKLNKIKEVSYIN